MITINLLSKSSKSGKDGGGAAEAAFEQVPQEVQVQGLIRLLILASLSLGLYSYESMNIPKLRGILNRANAELRVHTEKNDKAKAAVEEIKKYKVIQAKLQEQINTIEALRKDRMREVRILDLLQREIPEKMWLSKVDIKDGKLVLTGYAGTDGDLTLFMDVLNRSTILGDINLIKVNEVVQDSTTVKEFTINGVLKRPDQEKPVEKPGGTT